MNLEALYKLQGLEDRLNEVRHRLKEQREGKEIRKLKEEYQRLKLKLEKDEESLQANRKRQEDSSKELKLVQMNQQTSEAVKFSRDTDTIKKLENIEKHIERLNQQKISMENELIKLIEAADTIEKDMTETKKKLNFIKKKYSSVKEAAGKDEADLPVEEEQLQRQIEIILKTVDSECLELFRRIRRNHSDAVVALEGRKCAGCKVELPAMDYEAVKAEKAVIRCESCGRLLYHQKA